MHPHREGSQDQELALNISKAASEPRAHGPGLHANWIPNATEMKTTVFVLWANKHFFFASATMERELEKADNPESIPQWPKKYG